MILHTLSAAPGTNAFRDCLSVASTRDAILLLGDGVYAALPASTFLAGLLDTGADVHILRDDAQAAGIAEPAAGVTPAGMAEFVALTERFPRQMAWF